jgi:hypothetical protein
MKIDEMIAKILGMELPLLCDGHHPKGGCNLEKVQEIKSFLLSALKQQREEIAKRIEKLSYIGSVSDYNGRDVDISDLDAIRRKDVIEEIRKI